MADKHVLITGGAGFIGSHVVRLFIEKYPEYHIINLDKLTYAGNLQNLQDVENAANYDFVKGDINDKAFVEKLFKDQSITDVIHLAAESHVDRSIHSPLEFVQTNVIGTVNLLEAARSQWSKDGQHTFYHISTDEVFGSLYDPKDFFREDTPYDPRSPYSASKASSDHFVKAYENTYDLPVVMSNCSNNYGPNQFPEKLIPLCINNIKHKKPLPIYGKGDNVRDWLYVLDHARAIDVIFHKGEKGQTYCVGGKNEWENLRLVKTLCRILDHKLGRNTGESEQLITFVTDRAGHDKRYAIDPSKIEKDLGWSPSVTFEQGLKKTVDWYLKHQEWMENVTSGDYRSYYEEMYTDR